MERPSRNRKQVNYADVQDFDDDEDFACVKAPPSKKARVPLKEPEHRNEKPASRSQEAETQLTKGKQRPSLDDKLYERDLEAALTLSMLQTDAVGEPLISDKGERNQPLTEAKTVTPSPLLSNCSVDFSLLGLDKVTDERGCSSAPSRQRQAASRASEQQRRMLQEETDSTAENARDEEYQPTCTPDAESESEADFGDESDEEEFAVKKVEKKKATKKEKPSRPPAPKKEKKPSKATKSKLQATVTPSVSYSPAPAKIPATSSPVSRPAAALSPAGGRLPKWNPPAQIGKGPTTPNTVQVKSPGQGLRLGLSRLARVKSLHPSSVSH